MARATAIHATSTAGQPLLVLRLRRLKTTARPPIPHPRSHALAVPISAFPRIRELLSYTRRHRTVMDIPLTRKATFTRTSDWEPSLEAVSEHFLTRTLSG